MARLWPIAHPAPVVARLNAEARYAHFAIDFESDLRQTITLLLSGLRD